MEIEIARALCRANRLTIVEERDLNYGKGTQLRTAEGPMLNVYKTGKCVPGGKNQHLLKSILEGHGREPAATVLEAERLSQLEAENMQLKVLLAERDLVIDKLQDRGGVRSGT
jgi:predicted nucleotide-binding protein